MSNAPSLAESKKRLRAFAKSFRDAANEQQQASIFWTKFYECYGIRPESATIYEQRVSKLSGAVGRIDSFIPGKLIVEHKSKGANLEKAYEQAQEYFLALPEVERPKYIITSDFARIYLYDLAAKKSYKTALGDLPKHANWFKFLIDDKPQEIEEEKPINRSAAYAISKLHEGLLRINFKGKPLEVFLTRILFCLFADDTGIFGEEQQFRWLVEKTKQDGTDLGARLTDLFGVLDKPVPDRQTTLDDELAAFAYINGDLFREHSEIPAFDSNLRQQLLDCIEMDWSEISPAIFGAMFQGVLEEHSPDERRQATRRETGAHYTSERNILRVINPLFLDDLKAELEAARRNKPRLKALYDKLPTLTFLDPACGCGNFLVIAYRELRRLENDVIAELFNFEKGKGLLDVSTLCRVKVSQFYGIEIDDAAAHIARVAMWITDHQMNEEAARRFGTTRPTIPLVDSPHIVCANALRMDWNSLIPSEQCNYIFGNPPFVGAKLMSDEQRRDVAPLFAGLESGGLLDYVAGWHLLAVRYLKRNPNGAVCFVSTSSICQGEQVGVLWSHLLAQGIFLRFAHRFFQWSNDAKGVAAVYCVIVGYGLEDRPSKRIFDYSADIAGEGVERVAKHINPYLVDAPDVVMLRRAVPLCPVPEIGIGNKPIDGGNYLFTPEERTLFLQREPQAESLFRRWFGADEFLYSRERWFLWLGGCTPEQLRSMPEVMKRVQAVREFRLASKSKPTQKLAATPTRFHVENIPSGSYLLIPRHSSESRIYVPLGFIEPSVLTGDACLISSAATIYHFGVLSSAMHNAWIRAVCGRLEGRYRYSAAIVYNNFPWCLDAPDGHTNAISQAAQGVLDARGLFPTATLADLYDPLTTPQELLKAHEKLDRAVDAAYRYKGAHDDAARVAFLFEMYTRLTSLFVYSGKRVRKAKAAIS